MVNLSLNEFIILLDVTRLLKWQRNALVTWNIWCLIQASEFRYTYDNEKDHIVKSQFHQMIMHPFMFSLAFLDHKKS